tara:strand:- start:147 stop:323 length:177 start_codon:yes stop_codon:yes gene_type:complete
MNKIIEKLDNGDFKVVSTSYDIPVNYIGDTKLQSRLGSGKCSTNTTRYTYKYSIYRDN